MYITGPWPLSSTRSAWVVSATMAPPKVTRTRLLSGWRSTRCSGFFSQPGAGFAAMVLSLFGGLRGWCLTPIGACRLLAAIERGDAAIIELRTLQRPAFLGDAFGAERRVAAQQLLILLALTHVLIGRFVSIV